MVRPDQIWDRRIEPLWAVTVIECGAGKVTYMMQSTGAVVTMSKFNFKKIYKRRRR
jgi:hypothetical protein